MKGVRRRITLQQETELRAAAGICSPRWQDDRSITSKFSGTSNRDEQFHGCVILRALCRLGQVLRILGITDTARVTAAPEAWLEAGDYREWRPDVPHLQEACEWFREQRPAFVRHNFPIGTSRDERPRERGGLVDSAALRAGRC